MNTNILTIDINFLQKYGLYINIYNSNYIFLLNNKFNIINLFKK